MPSWLWAALAIGVAGLGFSLLRAIRTQDAQAERCEALFFESAGRVIESGNVPDAIVRMIEATAHSIRSRWPMWRFLWFVLSGGLRASITHPSVGLQQFEADWKMLTEETRKNAAIAFATGLLAMTYRSLLAGAVLRQIALIYPVKNNSCEQPPPAVGPFVSRLAAV